MADPSRGGAVVHAVEERVGLATSRRTAPLPAQHLVDVGLVPLRIRERQAPDKALRSLNVLELERHLVEIPEEELIAGDEVGVVVVVDVLTPALRLLEGHPRRDSVDPEGPAEVCAGVDQRLDPGDEAVAVLALGSDHRPPLSGDVVARGAEIVEGEPSGHLALVLIPFVAGGVVRQARVEHRRVLVGVGEEEV